MTDKIEFPTKRIPISCSTYFMENNGYVTRPSPPNKDIMALALFETRPSQFMVFAEDASHILNSCSYEMRSRAARIQESEIPDLYALLQEIAAEKYPEDNYLSDKNARTSILGRFNFCSINFDGHRTLYIPVNFERLKAALFTAYVKDDVMLDIAVDPDTMTSDIRTIRPGQNIPTPKKTTTMKISPRG